MKTSGMFILLVMISSLSGCFGVKGEPVEYAAQGISLNGFLAYDSSIKGKRPGILVVHEWWGHNEYARRRAKMLAEMGYTALAVDMYGSGKQAMHPDDAGAFAKEVMENMEEGRARFTAALNLLKNHETVDPRHIAAIGYCFGGGIVLHMARSGADLDGVVSFHGSLSTKEFAKPGSVRAKILVCHGADDTIVPPGQLVSFREEMKMANADFRILIYEGAKHSFTNPEADVYAGKFNLPVGYNEKADRKSWADMQEFLSSLFE